MALLDLVARGGTIAMLVILGIVLLRDLPRSASAWTACGLFASITSYLTYVLGLRAALQCRFASGAGRSHAWRRPEFIARQAARPSGVLGWILGHIMRGETAAANDVTIELADITGSERVLDVGRGPGHAVARVAARLTTGRVVGVDPSPTMIRLATRRNRLAISRGKVGIEQGDAIRLPFATASFDRIVTTHTVYFWPDLAPVARELRRVLRPDGLLVLGFADTESMRPMFPDSVYTLRPAAEIRRAFLSAGFTEARIETRDTLGQTLLWLRARGSTSLN